MQLKARLRAMDRLQTAAALGNKGRSWANFTGLMPASKAYARAKNHETFDEAMRLAPYENRLERDFMAVLEARLNVLVYTPRPAPLAWRYETTNCRTVFEFCYVRRDRHRCLVAVKSLSKIEKYDLRELYSAARVFALQRGYADLEVWTEHEVRDPPELANAEAKIFQRPLGAFENEHRDFRNELAVRGTLEAAGGRLRIGQLRDRSGLGDEAWRAILRLIDRGAIVPRRSDVVLDDHAEIMRPGMHP